MKLFSYLKKLKEAGALVMLRYTLSEQMKRGSKEIIGRLGIEGYLSSDYLSQEELQLSHDILEDYEDEDYEDF